MQEIDDTQLQQVLGAELSSFVHDLPHDVLTGAQAAQQLHATGLPLVTLGASSWGVPIQAAIAGHGSKTAMLYAYPHPEEPLGAQVIVALARAAQAGDSRLDALLSTWRLVLIACADPDMASLNAGWVEGGSLTDLVWHGFRPEGLSREVDYGFPIDYGPLYQPWHEQRGLRCRQAAACVEPEVCGPVCARLMMPAPALPESLVLATAIRKFRPDLIVAMHNSPLGGQYDFLSWKPTQQLRDTFDLISAATGCARHRGEPIDPARSWFRERPDLLKEPDLSRRLKYAAKVQTQHPGMRFAGNVSIAQHAQSVLGSTCRIFMPEAVSFTDTAFSDLSLSRQVRHVDIVHTKQGISVRGRIQMPDMSYRHVRYGSKIAPHVRGGIVELQASMLGVETVELRRWTEQKLQDIYHRASTHARAAASPIAAELRAGTSRGSYRRHVDPAVYRRMAPRLATIADVAYAEWTVPSQMAQRLGLLGRFLRQHDPEQTELLCEVQTLIEQLLMLIPSHVARNIQGRSQQDQLARVLAVMTETAA